MRRTCSLAYIHVHFASDLVLPVCSVCKIILELHPVAERSTFVWLHVKIKRSHSVICVSTFPFMSVGLEI